MLCNMHYISLKDLLYAIIYIVCCTNILQTMLCNLNFRLYYLLCGLLFFHFYVSYSLEVYLKSNAIFILLYLFYIIESVYCKK